MMESISDGAMKAMWIAWLIYWFAASRRVKATRWREGWRVRILDLLPLILAAILMAAREWLPAPLVARFLPPGVMLAVVGALLTGIGLGFSVWARVHLGRNWSGTVTLKDDHALIRSGPYRFVRHPIYTGLLLAAAGTVLAIGEWRGIVALALLFLAFLRRVRAEETQMRMLFADYARYANETAALIPFVY